MKNILFEFYRPTEDEFRELWNKCYFITDANVLLNLYRYSKETSESLIDILNQISQRLWIPHQVALEFHNNRLTVISDQKKAYENILEQLSSYQKKIDNDVNNFKNHQILSGFI